MVTMNIFRLPIDSSFDDRVNQIAFYLYPIIEAIGSIINILKCRRPILISSCSYYFLAFAFSSLHLVVEFI
jgi:hypothetical protein